MIHVQPQQLIYSSTGCESLTSGSLRSASPDGQKVNALISHFWLINVKKTTLFITLFILNQLKTYCYRRLSWFDCQTESFRPIEMKAKSILVLFWKSKGGNYIWIKWISPTPGLDLGSAISVSGCSTVIKYLGLCLGWENKSLPLQCCQPLTFLTGRFCGWFRNDLICADL